jgi:hypothetical protein
MRVNLNYKATFILYQKDLKMTENKTVKSTKLTYIDKLMGNTIRGVVFVYTSQKIVNISLRLAKFCNQGDLDFYSFHC